MKFKKPKYGEVKCTKRFAIFPTEVEHDGEDVTIWLEVYYDVYKFIECREGDYWSRGHSVSKESYEKINRMK